MKFIICDCSSAEIMCIRKELPLSKIILCYFHIIQNCERKSPQLRNKKKDLKKGALDLLVNIKLLLFKIILKYFSKSI